MVVEIRFVLSSTLLLALQATVVLSKDDSGLTGCSYFSSAEYLQRPGSLRDRFNELPGAKKGLSRQSWKTLGDENQQNNILNDGDDQTQESGWSAPNQKIWGKRGVGSETGDLERRNMKLCESEKRKWGRNNQKVWGKREETLSPVEPDQSKQAILGAMLLNYGSGKEPTDDDSDLNFPADDDKQLEADSTGWSDGFELPGTEKKAWGQNKARVWGKRSVLEEDKRKWGQNKAMVWGKRAELQDDEDKRKWGQSKAMVWGKREELRMDEEKRKWGQSKAMVWGKRGEVPNDEDKRRWGQNKAAVWGKRDDLLTEEEKRKWGQSKAMVWGKRDDLLTEEEKRKWGQSKAMVWGKRDGLITDEEKRKWGQNKAKVWGKRESPNDQQILLSEIEPLTQGLNGEAKRKWGHNKAKVWGKRDTQVEEKRRWGKNSAKVWGKRDESEEDKRKWGNNKAKVWGKRNDFEEEKRKWGSNKARVWGKRQKQEEASPKPLTNAMPAVLEKSEDGLNEEKRKWAQNKAKVWGKRDVLLVMEKEQRGRNRAKAAGNLSATAQPEKTSQNAPLRNLPRQDVGLGRSNILDTITEQFTAKKMCVRNKTMVPCQHEEETDGEHKSKRSLPEKYHVIDDVAKMAPLVRSDSNTMALL